MKARDAMRRPPAAIGSGATIPEAARLMERRSVGAQPSDRFALTEQDYVIKLIARTPVFVFLDATLREAARILTAESIGALLVQGPHGPAGLLSERDIVAALAEGAHADRDRVRDFMTPDVASVEPSATIRQARECMLENQIRHLAVVKGEKTIGLISIRDVLAAR